MKSTAQKPSLKKISTPTTASLMHTARNIPTTGKQYHRFNTPAKKNSWTNCVSSSTGSSHDGRSFIASWWHQGARLQLLLSFKPMPSPHPAEQRKDEAAPRALGWDWGDAASAPCPVGPAHEHTLRSDFGTWVMETPACPHLKEALGVRPRQGRDAQEGADVLHTDFPGSPRKANPTLLSSAPWEADNYNWKWKMKEAANFEFNTDSDILAKTTLEKSLS